MFHHGRRFIAVLRAILLAQGCHEALGAEVIVPKAIDLQPVVAVLREKVRGVSFLKDADVARLVAERLLAADELIRAHRIVGDRVPDACGRVFRSVEVHDHDPSAVGVGQHLRTLNDAVGRELTGAGNERIALVTPGRKVIG